MLDLHSLNIHHRGKWMSGGDLTSYRATFRGKNSSHWGEAPIKFVGVFSAGLYMKTFCIEPKCTTHLKNAIHEYRKKVKMEVVHYSTICLSGAFIYTSQLKFHRHLCVHSSTYCTGARLWWDISVLLNVTVYLCMCLGKSVYVCVCWGGEAFAKYLALCWSQKSKTLNDYDTYIMETLCRKVYSFNTIKYTHVFWLGTGDKVKVGGIALFMYYNTQVNGNTSLR